MRQTFRPLDYGCIVPAESLSHLAGINVQKLWIRTQELSAREGSARSKAGACQLWPAKKWIRYRLRQRRTKRQIFRIDLVDIHGGIDRSAESDAIASCSNVANFDRHTSGEFSLDIDGILLHARRFSILVDVTDGCAGPAHGAFAVPGWTDDAIRERVIERDGGNWRSLWRYSVLRVADLPVIVVGRAWNRIVEARPKDPVTATQDGSRIERIGNTSTRGPF